MKNIHASFGLVILFHVPNKLIFNVQEKTNIENLQIDN